MSGAGEGFLARWSRRKRGEAAPGEEAAEREAAPPLSPADPDGGAPAAVPVALGARAAPASPAVARGARSVAPPPPPFDLASLPSLDGLGTGSDVRAFLAKGVPAALRTAALRKVWHLDPAIRDFVGPADYAWDYNAPGGVPGFTADLPEEVSRWAMRRLDGTAASEGAGEAKPDDAEADGATAEAVAQPPVAPLIEAEVPPAAEGEAYDATVVAVRRHGGAVPT